MNKRHLNLLIDAGLLQRARDNGLVISKFLEVKLQEYFTFMDAITGIQNDRSGLVEIRTQDLLRVRETS